MSGCEASYLETCFWRRRYAAGANCFYPVSPFALGAIQRLVSVLQQVFHASAANRIRGRNSHAQGDWHLCECSGDCLAGDEAANLVGTTRSNRGAASRKHQQKLFAAIATSQIVVPEIALQAASYFLQDDVAGGVAE